MPGGIRQGKKAATRRRNGGRTKEKIRRILNARADGRIQLTTAHLLQRTRPVQRLVLHLDTGFGKDLPRQLNKYAWPLGAWLAIRRAPDIPGDHQRLGPRPAG